MIELDLSNDRIHVEMFPLGYRSKLVRVHIMRGAETVMRLTMTSSQVESWSATWGALLSKYTHHL